MVRELVALQIGQCGNQIGSKFWEVICDEHGIDKDGSWIGLNDNQLDRMDVYFTEVRGQRFVPRAVLVDMDPASLDVAKEEPYGRLFRPDNFIKGERGCANNFAKGAYSEGPDKMDRIMEVIRKEAETCQCLQGFQIAHSIGGGTGSGLACKIMEAVRDEYPDRVMMSYSVCPSVETSDAVVETYNTVNSLNYLINHCDGCVMLDNDGLYDICQNTLRLQHPTFGDINHLIAATMSGVTCSLRFPGQLNASVRKLLVNMVPFPRLHFFMAGFSPLTARTRQDYRSVSVFDLTRQIFTPENVMSSCNPTRGRYLTASAIYRGKLSTHEIEDQLRSVQDKNTEHFVPWIPHNIKTAVCDVAPAGLKISVAFLGNNTAIQREFSKFLRTYTRMLRKKAFLHWYTNEGMDEGEFTESESHCQDMISEYQMYQDAQIDEDSFSWSWHNSADAQVDASRHAARHLPPPETTDKATAFLFGEISSDKDQQEDEKGFVFDSDHEKHIDDHEAIHVDDQSDQWSQVAEVVVGKPLSSDDEIINPFKVADNNPIVERARHAQEAPPSGTTLFTVHLPQEDQISGYVIPDPSMD